MTHKLCKDCKWYERGECLSPKTSKNLVDGSTIYNPYFQRTFGWPFYYIEGICGKPGRFWEKKDEK